MLSTVGCCVTSACSRVNPISTILFICFKYFPTLSSCCSSFFLAKVLTHNLTDHNPTLLCFQIPLYPSSTSWQLQHLVGHLHNTNSLPGSGAESRAWIDINTVLMVSAGLHSFFRMSKHMAPVSLEMLGCQILVRNFIYIKQVFTFGGLYG